MQMGRGLNRTLLSGAFMVREDLNKSVISSKRGLSKVTLFQQHLKLTLLITLSAS